MEGIFVRCSMGAEDLYHGVPNLDTAKFLGVDCIKEGHTTVLKFELETGKEYRVFIRPE